MAEIFISHTRRNADIVASLARDIEALGHGTWFDQDLSGGQVWWDQILARIRACDVFVFALSPAALDSIPCQREYGYAADLGKPILPVLVADGVSANLLPSVLSRIQFVDFRTADRKAVLDLARAVSQLPPPKPLPDPLPPAPEVPLSYLTSLSDRVAAGGTLSYEQQTALLVELRRSLRDPDGAEDGRALLARLRKRPDLFARIAEEIDDLPASAGRSGEGGDRLLTHDQLSSALTTNGPAVGPTARQRLHGALAAGVLGFVVSIAGTLNLTNATPYPPPFSTVVVYSVISTAAGMAAGALGGTWRRCLLVGLFAAVGLIAVGLAYPTGLATRVALATYVGAPAGAVVGGWFVEIRGRRRRAAAPLATSRP